MGPHPDGVTSVSWSRCLVLWRGRGRVRSLRPVPASHVVGDEAAAQWGSAPFQLCHLAVRLNRLLCPSSCMPSPPHPQPAFAGASRDSRLRLDDEKGVAATCQVRISAARLQDHRCGAFVLTGKRIFVVWLYCDGIASPPPPPDTHSRRRGGQRGACSG